LKKKKTAIVLSQPDSESARVFTAIASKVLASLNEGGSK